MLKSPFKNATKSTLTINKLIQFKSLPLRILFLANWKIRVDKKEVELIAVSETNQAVNYSVHRNYNGRQKRKLSKLSTVEQMFKHVK